MRMCACAGGFTPSATVGDPERGSIMQTDENKLAAEDILNRLGRADKSPDLWQPAGSYRGDPLNPPPQSWVECAVSAALVLVGKEKLKHAQALRGNGDKVRLAFLTDSLLILSDSIDTSAPPLVAPLDAVPRAASPPQA